MLEDLKARLKGSEEGCLPYLYLDGLGLVTCAVGHMVPSAEAMDAIPMVRDGSPVSNEEKRAEWVKVKTLQAGMLPRWYAAHTALRLAPGADDALLDADLAEFERELRHYIPGFDTYPEPAQEAILDMAFGGVGTLVGHFPHLVAAVRARNWAECAKQCHRTQVQESRNQAIAGLFLEAAQAAQGRGGGAGNALLRSIHRCAGIAP